MQIYEKVHILIRCIESNKKGYGLSIPERIGRSIMKKKIGHLIFTSALFFCLTACQKEATESALPESEAQTQTEEAKQTVQAETEVSDQKEESSQAAEEIETRNFAKEVQNEFFKVVYDSFSEDEDFYIITFIFSNVSDMVYYKGDELYQPGEFWEKKIRIEKENWADFCKNPSYIHYPLYDASVYDENANVLFSGGASFETNEAFEVYNLEIFGGVPIEE